MKKCKSVNHPYNPEPSRRFHKCAVCGLVFCETCEGMSDRPASLCDSCPIEAWRARGLRFEGEVLA